jgi:hypothetical protein
MTKEREALTLILEAINTPNTHSMILAKIFNIVRHELAQPEREWVGLTDEQIQKIWDVASGAIPNWSRHIAYARAIKAKLKELNT